MPEPKENMEQTMTNAEMPKSDLPITSDNGTYFITISDGITFEHLSSDQQPASGEKIKLGTTENLIQAIRLRQGDKTFTFQQEKDGQVVTVEQSYPQDKDDKYNIDDHTVIATHLQEGEVSINIDGEIKTVGYMVQIPLDSNSTIEARKIIKEPEPYLILRRKFSI